MKAASQVSFELTRHGLERAQNLHHKSSIVDCLAYVPTLKDARYLRSLIDAGVTCCHVTVPGVADDLHGALEKISLWQAALSEEGVPALLVRSARDILRARESGKVAVIMGAQNAKPMGDRLHLARVMSLLGLGIVQITYQEQNLLGAGCGEPQGGGLTRLGRRMLECMEDAGIIPDVSHCNDLTTYDVLQAAQSPVLMTHANPRAVVDHIRNKTDDQLRMVAETRGVVGINAWSRVLARDPDARPTVEDFLDCIDYVVELLGDDYVGLGLDLDPMWTHEDYTRFKAAYPELCGKFSFEYKHAEGIDSPEGVWNITLGLVARGYSDESISKILGGNFVRVFEEVWH